MGSQSIEAGKAFLRLLVDDKDFRKGLDGSLRKLDSFGKSIQGVGLKFSIAGAAMIAPFVASLKVFQQVGEELKHLSDKTGLSVESLSELKYAAEQSETSLGAVAAAIRGMQRAITNAAGGNTKAIAAFSELGVSIEELQRLSPQQQFERIAKAVAAVRDPTLRAGLAMKVFGRSGGEILGLAANFDALQARFEKLGLTISTETAKAADDFGDSLTDMKFVAQAVAVNIGGALAPELTKLAEKLAQSSKGIIEWVKNNRSAVVVAGELAAAVLLLGNALVVLGTGLRVAAFAGTGFKAAIAAATAHPYIAALLAVGAAILAIATYFRQASDAAKDFAGDLSAAISAKVAEVKRLEAAFLTFGDAESEMEQLAIAAIRSSLERARQELADLRAQVAAPLPVNLPRTPALVNRGVPVPPRGKGNFREEQGPITFGGVGPNLLFEAMTEAAQAAARQLSRKDFRDSAGFKVGEGVQQQLQSNSRTAFGGRLAGQIFGSGASTIPQRHLKEAEKANKKLDEVKAAIENFGPGFKIGVA